VTVAVVLVVEAVEALVSWLLREFAHGFASRFAVVFVGVVGFQHRGIAKCRHETDPLGFRTPLRVV
jgi:hypothetical protein